MHNVIGVSTETSGWSVMRELLLICTLILGSVIPAHGLSSNIQHGLSFEKAGGSQWAVSGRNRQQGDIVSSTDSHDHMLTEGSLQYLGSPSIAWPKLNAAVHCGVENMTLRLLRLTPSPLDVKQNGSWVSASQMPPHCGYAVSRKRRLVTLQVPYNGCEVTKKNGVHRISIRSGNAKIAISCPSPHDIPQLLLNHHFSSH
ncbi:hypothetical protein AAFF_G00344020 [Aldrovandia affinis]|uniref:Uncharacterized protein n=1 Tax=Aldrovandia affinis TaxID=143900 RepID=A0AAD7WP24_9TELE|nr:hypothetical protein AAFF_G00344020 [Aldrovandia affinis]